MMRFLKSYSDTHLDTVAFLAILGEGSILANAQVASLSRLFYLPRLLPAPQALLRPSRPAILAPHIADVAGVQSGNHKRHVNHVAHVLINGEAFPKHSVRVYKITRNSDAAPDLPKAKTKAPLSVVALLGCAFSLALLILSILMDDGMALLATILLSFLSTVIGIGQKWKLELTKRTSRDTVPPGDVVIRYPKGNFLVIKCTEETSRELYFAPEEIEYQITRPEIYRLISLLGTLMLMFGVICLGSATLPLQICFAASYMLLNAAYWIVAALPHKLHWNLTCFRVEEQKIEKPEPTTFTEALWQAIVVTKSTEWCKTGKAAPTTEAWNQWLHDAEVQARTVGQYVDRTPCTTYQLPDWNPQEALRELMNPSRV
ncbi:hypothetical protein BJ546DRAFT_1058815 [Cryomyces antarcticus]